MTLAESLLPEFDHEMGVTRRLLERVPDGQLSWAPHEKSMTLGRLAQHLSELPRWCSATITQSGIELNAGRPPDPLPGDGARGIVASFDRNVSDARAALVGRTDAELLAPWTLAVDGKEMFTMPKATVLRSFVMNHMVHHRGQLSVYLRLQNVLIPSMYGPSADEPM